MNVCPVCRNVNQRNATTCRYCGTTLTPPAPEVAAAPAPRRRWWPWIVGAVAILLVIGVTGVSLLGGGGAQAAGGAKPLEVGTDTGTALQFVPKTVDAPPNTQVSLTFNNHAALAHNLTFKAPINAATAPQVETGKSETITFTTPAPGTYPFDCTIHPGMEGNLVVK